MAYVANTYEGGHVAATDLQQIENNFEYLRTNFKSGSAPADPGGGLEGVVWRDTTKDLLKIRGSSAWQGILALTKPASGYTGLVWLHDNDANEAEGWGIDTSITEDRVIALKNHGAGTYTTGRVAAGAWVISGLSSSDSGHTHNHNHQWYGIGAANQPDTTFNINGDSTPVTGASKVFDPNEWGLVANEGTTFDHPSAAMYTDDDDTSGTASITTTQNGSWRIRAQVGIVIYPDM